jgi:hypothetical protein
MDVVVISLWWIIVDYVRDIIYIQPPTSYKGNFVVPHAATIPACRQAGHGLTALSTALDFLADIL